MIIVKIFLVVIGIIFISLEAIRDHERENYEKELKMCLTLEECMENFSCPKCNSRECELEQDFDENEITSEDLVCNNCGYREILF